jgi:hypothetical protein
MYKIIMINYLPGREYEFPLGIFWIVFEDRLQSVE